MAAPSLLFTLLAPVQAPKGAQLTDSRTAAHPPWPAAFSFQPRTRGHYAVTLVGPWNLRLDSGRDAPFVGEAARWNDSGLPAMVLDDADHWVWKYLEARLGKTKEKEYLTPKRAPDYLELPKRP